MEIFVKSSSDGTLQPSLFCEASEPGRPLLVNLHSWSYDRYNKIDTLVEYCNRYNWNLLSPDFRGPNIPENPDVKNSCASTAAMEDILDAVEYICENYQVDKTSILLLGASGGGHMTLMMCGHKPKLWRAAMAWVPITDLAKWYVQKKEVGAKYCNDILAVVGAEPDEVPESYSLRSPISYIDSIAQSRLCICHGLYDQSVNVRHSLDFYSELQSRHPNASVYLNIFDGKHEINYDDAFRSRK